MHLRDLVERPLIHVHASPACNLKCTYCTIGDILTDRVTRDFLPDGGLLDVLERIPPTHIYLSGGEPLFHPSTREFVAHAGRNGHRVTFDTNLVINRKKLGSFLEYWNPDWIGYFNISHHILSNVRFEKLLERVQLLRAHGIPFYVKYIGAPESFADIEYNMKTLRDEGFGAAVTILYGPWSGRFLPRDYTTDEVLRLLELVTMNAHGLQVFGGVYSHGLPCRSGQDAVVWNMMDDRAVIPCCHGMDVPLDMGETFFATGNRERLPCQLESCLGYTYFIYGINGVAEEIDRFDALVNGEWEFLGPERVFAYLQDIKDRGFSLVDDAKFLAARRRHAGFPEEDGEFVPAAPLPAITTFVSSMWRRFISGHADG